MNTSTTTGSILDPLQSLIYDETPLDASPEQGRIWWIQSKEALEFRNRYMQEEMSLVNPSATPNLNVHRVKKPIRSFIQEQLILDPKLSVPLVVLHFLANNSAAFLMRNDFTGITEEDLFGGILSLFPSVSMRLLPYGNGKFYWGFQGIGLRDEAHPALRYFFSKFLIDRQNLVSAETAAANESVVRTKPKSRLVSSR